MYFDSSRLSHAYITDRQQAGIIANAVVCSAPPPAERPCRLCRHCIKASRDIHPDIIIITTLADKKIISVEQIRDIKRDAIILPNEADKKVYIIKDADLMNINAQNALLQVLEEPPAHTVFILQTEHPVSLIRTVRSRCVELRAAPVSAGSAEQTIEMAADELANEFAKALTNHSSTADRNVLMVDCMFKLEKQDSQVFSAFLTSANRMLVTLLKGDHSPGSSPFRRKLVEAEGVLAKAEDMLKLNVSIGHLTGMITAQLIEIE